MLLFDECGVDAPAANGAARVEAVERGRAAAPAGNQADDVETPPFAPK